MAKPLCEQPNESLKRTYKSNIKMNLKEVVYEGRKLIELAPDKLCEFEVQGPVSGYCLVVYLRGDGDDSVIKMK
jgi:hypothetical protein